MARGAGFLLPEDEEPQPWRSIMLMKKSIARTNNCRVWNWFMIRIWRGFTPGDEFMKIIRYFLREYTTGSTGT
jgi:hypothetical protein